MVADIAAENAQRTVDAILEAGGEASAFIGDATSGDDCQAMVATAVERYGGLHVLMNNLGFRWGGHDGRKGVAEIDEDVLMRAFDLNLKSAVLASKFAIPAMIASGRRFDHQRVVDRRNRGSTAPGGGVFDHKGRAADPDAQHGGLSWSRGDTGQLHRAGALAVGVSVEDQTGRP